MTDVITAFGLTLDPDRFGAPGLALPGDGQDRITTALRQAAADAGIDLKARRQRPGPLRTALLEAMVALRDQDHVLESLHLAAAVAQPHPKVAMMQAQLLKKLEARDVLATFLAAQLDNPDLPAASRRSMWEMQMREKNMGASGAVGDHATYMDGPLPATLAEALDRLPGSRDDWVAPQLADMLVDLNGLSGAAAETYRARLNWGAAAQEYITFLTRHRGAPDEAPDAETAQLRRLAQGLRQLVRLPDPNPLTAARALDKSIVLTTAHLGVGTVGGFLVNPLRMPQVTISANAETNFDNPQRLLLGTQGNAQVNFLKLIKIVRKGRYLVRVLPDGVAGSEPRRAPFLGTEVDLGPGAAVLAWQASAATYFFGTRWQDGALQIYVHAGPVAEKGGDRAAFEAAFYDFYLGCLTEIVTGPPEDITPRGAFWRRLARERRLLARVDG